jgi:hypothetical protein
MNLKTLKKDSSSSIYKQADSFVKLNNIRELEEEKPLHFIAFVDDGPESYDVSLELDTAFNIINSNCDCTSSDAFCSHKLAVAIHIKERDGSKPSSVAKKIKARKVDPIRQLIDDIHIEQLKEWVHELCKTNKEFHLILKNRFEKSPISLLWEDIESIHIEKQKGILKNAKYYDASQLLKILALLKDYHTQLIDEIFLQEVIDLSLLDRLLKYLAEFNNRARKKGERLMKYIESLTNTAILKFSMLSREKKLRAIEDWTKIFIEDKLNSGPLTNLLIETYFDIVDTRDTSILVSLIKAGEKFENNTLRLTLLNLSAQKNILKDIISLFSKSRRNSDYNIRLIEYLIEYEYYYEAERITLTDLNDQFTYNYYKLRQLLIQIYTLNNQSDKKFEQLKETVLLDFNYDHYEEICDKLKDLELSNFKKRFKRNLDQARGSHSYAKFYLAKYTKEKNWNEIINLLDGGYPILFVQPVVSHLIAYNRDKVLRKLIKRRWDRYGNSPSKKEQEIYIEILKSNYDREDLIKLIKNSDFYFFEVETFILEAFAITRADTE